jgi:hypothetical protein
MRKTGLGLLVVAVLPFMAAGCLLKDRTDTLYLEPGGALTWSVMEKDVRSDANDPVDRQAEEATYMTDVRGQTGPLPRGFRSLGASEIHTKILRGTSPYTVVTEARFASVDLVGQRMIERVGLAGSSVLEVGAAAALWTLTMRDPHAAGPPSQNDEDLNALTEGLSGLRIILTDGHFVAAGTDGFDISGDGRAAAVRQNTADDKALDDGGQIVKALKWTVR